MDDGHIPDEAKPDCESCEKPELDHSSYEAVHLFNVCINQQEWNQMSGHRMGLRMEAVKAALDELCLMGQIEDRSRAFQRVFIIDDAVNRVLNDRLDASARAKSGDSAQAS